MRRWLPTTLMTAAVAGLAAVVVLSTLPGPVLAPWRTGMAPHLEHILAYALVTVVLWKALLARWPRAATLAAPAIVFPVAAVAELLQSGIPGRHAGIDGFLASACGAVAGVAFAGGAAWMWRWRR